MQVLVLPFLRERKGKDMERHSKLHFSHEHFYRIYGQYMAITVVASLISKVNTSQAIKI